jgi:hypothetical protein
MFGKFGWLDNEEKKLLGECILYIPLLCEHLFLHLLLTIVLGATFFEHLRIVDNTEHSTFQATCGTLGLL